MSVATVPGLLQSLRVLFYISSLFGVVPYSLRGFLKHGTLQLSVVGNIYVICSIILYTFLYHVGTINYADEDWGSQKTLTNAIGIFIIYMEPLMMSTDMLAGILNQKRLIDCFDRLNRVDGRLASEGILLDNMRAKRTAILLLLAVLLFEAVITVYSVVCFETTFSLWSMIWFITPIPTALNSVCRIWYVILVLAVRQRLNAMNGHMNAIAQGFMHYKEQFVGEADFEAADISIDYLEREIFTVYTQHKNKQLAVTPPKKKSQQATPKIITVKPYEGKRSTPPVQGSAVKPEMLGPALEYLPRDMRQRPKVNQRMDSKLVLICRTHDELCEIGKSINRMYSVQMLVAMAHGFVAITAQFYFLYCGLTGQDVPILFRSAEVLLLSMAFISYTALKCVVPIFVCWKTKTDSQRTGIEMHYLANVIDECHCYEIVNHLSLKLLNHQLNFSACGFFDLDMTTLYAITGAITSYLIILIQFNLAAIQKSSGNSTAATNVTTTALSTIVEVSTALTTYASNK